MYFHAETFGRTCTESPQRDTQAKWIGSNWFRTDRRAIDRQCIRNPIWNGLTYGTDARSKDGKKGRDCDLITAGQAFKRKPWTALGSKQRGPRPTRGR